MTAPKPHKPPERLMVYIDGFNLYHGLHDEAQRSLLWVDFVELSRSLRPRSRLVGVKYFTAPVLDDPGALSRQSHHQSAVIAKHGPLFSVTQGRYQKKTFECKGCHRVHNLREEKETDVNIAINFVADALSDAFDSALLISADSDLAPAVRMVQALKPHSFVVAAFPPRRYSNELKALMPASFAIGANKVKQAQLPETFNVNTSTYKKPLKWS